MDIKIRLVQLGRKQIELVGELRKRGFPKMSQPALSRFINGVDLYPQRDDVLAECEKIMDEWEQKMKEAE